jgi:exopolyphosphatase/guanosine-5'-triphosphate,3'-diphosphate pyrophosphatase
MGPMNSQPPPQTRAVIDIGTNSVKLLVATVAGSQITPLLETSTQTRLGSGFYATRQLQPAAIAATADAAARYSAAAAKLRAASIRVIATSAVRDALNAPELAAAILQQTGLPIQILSGEQEAEWVFRGVVGNPALASLPVLILDVGGGSTEFIVGQNSVPHFCRSYPLGTVRLLEQLQPPVPPGLDSLARCRALLRDFLEKQVVPGLQPALRQCTAAPQLVGTSGTASILARIEAKSSKFDRDQIEATVLPLARIRSLLEQQWQLPLALRRETPGLPPDRADVILTGIAIYESIMDRFAFQNLRISTRGLRYWALLHPPQPVAAVYDRR